MPRWTSSSSSLFLFGAGAASVTLLFCRFVGIISVTLVIETNVKLRDWRPFGLQWQGLASVLHLDIDFVPLSVADMFVVIVSVTLVIIETNVKMRD